MTSAAYESQKAHALNAKHTFDPSKIRVLVGGPGTAKTRIGSCGLISKYEKEREFSGAGSY